MKEPAEQLAQEKTIKRDVLENKILTLLTEEGIDFSTARSAMEHLLKRIDFGYQVYLADIEASEVLEDLEFKCREFFRRHHEDY